MFFYYFCKRKVCCAKLDILNLKNKVYEIVESFGPSGLEELEFQHYDRNHAESYR